MFSLKRSYILLSVLLVTLLFGLACNLSGEATPTPTGNTGSGAVATQQPKDESSSGNDAQPTTSSSNEAQPTSPAAGNTDELVIRHGAERVSDEGFVEIAGAVENTTDKWIGGIIVYVKLYDKDGNELGAVSTTGEAEQAVVASNDVIPPGGTAYFLYLRDVENIEGEFHHSKLAVQYREVEPQYRATAEISNLTIGDLKDMAIDISGLFTNSGEVTCLKPAVVAVGFNSEGLVYEVDELPLEDDRGEILSALEPGEKAQFKISLFNPDSAIADVKVVASCASHE